jgi:isopenicillin-N N-acyltransferase like protein
MRTITRISTNLNGQAMSSFPHVRVEGPALDRGRQYGSQAAGRVQRSVAAYRDVFAHYTGWDWATVRREAARFEKPIAAFRPGYLDEIRGIAEGAGLDPRDVLAINVRTEVMFAAKAARRRARRVPRTAAPRSRWSRPRARTAPP